MKQHVKSNVAAIFAAVCLVIVDQTTKFFAVQCLNPAHGGSDMILWDGVFRLKYLENYGAAFGIMQGKKAVLILFTLLVLSAICWIYQKFPHEKHFVPLRYLTVFVVAGAIGNFIDRMRLGYVVDFFYFEWIDFPIFNVADIYVTCAMALFILLFLFYYTEEDLNRILPPRKEKR